MPNACSPENLLRLLQSWQPRMLVTLKQLVLAESPSDEKAFCDRCCGLLASEWGKLGARVERIPQKKFGDQLRVTWWRESKRPAGQYFVLGHYDTVYASGSVAKMPFRVSGGKAFGPGIFDMKAGIVQALFALRAIQQLRAPLTHRLLFFWSSDEEIGSECSRRLIETEARRSDAVFVLEPSLGPRGHLKTVRKGVGEAEIIVHGRASHAGLAPEEGVNAIHELALQLTRIKGWNNPRRGLTVNADLIEGGTRVNVIAEGARAVLDLRALHASDIRRIEQRLHALRTSRANSGARIEVHGGFNRPPLERRMSAALFAKAQSLAAQMGLKLGEATAGGGSDGNLTAAVGAPTLDGLGAVGHGAHSANEHIVIRTMPARAALLAALLCSTSAG